MCKGENNLKIALQRLTSVIIESVPSAAWIKLLLLHEQTSKSTTDPLTIISLEQVEEVVVHEAGSLPIQNLIYETLLKISNGTDFKLKPMNTGEKATNAAGISGPKRRINTII